MPSPNLKKRKVRLYKLGMALMVAALLTTVIYLADNRVKPMNGENNLLRRFEYLKGDRFPARTDLSLEYVIINTSFDKALVDSYDDYGFYQGKEVVTDRSKLTRLLRECAKADSYKMVVIDLDLSSRTTDSTDRELVDAMRGMRDLYLVQLVDERGNLIPQMDISMEAYSWPSSYAKSLSESSFTRMPLSAGGKKSLPLVMAEQSEGLYYEDHGLYATYGGRLCNKKVFAYPYSQHNGTDADGTMMFKGYENLGVDVMEGDVGLITQGKIVMIGDYLNDRHETHIGDRSGTAIVLDTYYSLIRHRHLIRWWVWLVYGLVYTVAGFFILCSIQLNEAITLLRKAPWWIKFLLSFVGYGFLFGAIKLALYHFCDIDYNVIIPVAVFTLWSSLHKHRKKVDTINN